MKAKILIVDDDEIYLEVVKKVIKSNFGNAAEIFPKDEEENNLLVDKVKELDTEFLINNYKEIDLFILDVSVSDKSSFDAQTDGLILLEAIKKHIPNAKYIIVSNSGSAINKVDKKDQEYFVDKNFSSGLQKKVMVKLISKLMNIGIVKNKRNSKEDKSSFEEGFNKFRKRAELILDGLVMLVLMGTILISTVYGVIAVFNQFFAFEFKSSSILEFAEYIFIAFLPLFISLGFYTYYRYNGRMRLLKGKSSGEDLINSFKALNRTKILFISSVISFLTLKIIHDVGGLEKFKSNSLIEIIGSPMGIELITYNFLLIVLIVYLLFIKKAEHK